MRASATLTVAVQPSDHGISWTITSQASGKVAVSHTVNVASMPTTASGVLRPGWARRQPTYTGIHWKNGIHEPTTRRAAPT